MTKPTTHLYLILINFAALSLIAFGGANTIVPEMHKLVVDQYQIMNDQTFIDYFTLAQAAPGPNLLLSTLVGWHMAGVFGGIIVTVAFFILPALMIFFLTKTAHRFENKVSVRRLKTAIQPITLGFLGTSTYLIFTSAPLELTNGTLACGAFFLTYYTRFHPAWLIFSAIAIGIVEGFVG